MKTPIEQYEAEQRAYEEQRWARMARQDRPDPVNLCAEPADETDSDVSVMNVTFGFIALAVLAIIGLCWDTAPVQAVLHFLRYQP